MMTRVNIILLFLYSLFSFSQSCNQSNYAGAYRIPIASYPYFSPGSAITVSAQTNCSSLSNTSYSCQSLLYAGASPAWWINSNTQYIKFTFSAPVSKFTVLVNGTNQTEVFYFAASAGTVSLSDYCSPDFAATANTVTDVVIPAEGAIISCNVAGATSFTITHNGLGSGSRLTLLDCFVPAGLLPVELVNFKADCISKNNILLSWETASENNNNYFSVEKSRDALNWHEIKRIYSQGNSSGARSYSCIDQGSDEDVLYYRLKQTDFDGNYKHSAPIVVNSCNQKDEVVIYPNPSYGEFIISGSNMETIRVFNHIGKEVLFNGNSNGGQAKINLTGFPEGIYFLKIAEKYYKLVKQE